MTSWLLPGSLTVANCSSLYFSKAGPSSRRRLGELVVRFLMSVGGAARCQMGLSLCVCLARFDLVLRGNGAGGHACDNISQLDDEAPVSWRV